MPEAIHAYADKISATSGETISFMVSCEGQPREYDAQLVRLLDHGAGTLGTKFFERVPIPAKVCAARVQLIRAGSFAEVPVHSWVSAMSTFSFHAFVWPTTPAEMRQALISQWDPRSERGFALMIEGGKLTLHLGEVHGFTGAVSANSLLMPRVWYSLGASCDLINDRAILFVRSLPASRGSRIGPAAGWATDECSVFDIERGRRETDERLDLSGPDEDVPPPILLAARHQLDGQNKIVGSHFNGKLESASTYTEYLAQEDYEALSRDEFPHPDSLLACWNFSLDITRTGISSTRETDGSTRALHGRLRNSPTRGVTGHNWSGDAHSFVEAPSQYGAVHFHDDDLDDAGWEIDFTLDLPDSLRSAVYAMRLTAGSAEAFVPFVVRPSNNGPRSSAALLLPTTTYLAYANERSVFDASWTAAVDGRTPVLSTEDLFLNAHPEYGNSLYDLHSDGSGVCLSSRLRPIVNMDPRYRHRTTFLEEFPADLCIVAWLNHLQLTVDVITDEDLHSQGQQLLDPYRVILTGSHPEYCSSSMLDGLEGFIEMGGRLLYLGGNGFYWVTSFDPEKPHLIEVRRGESGTRAWQARPGEYFHSTTGERGGLWRYRGRPPQRLVGVGFAAQGFDMSAHYRRHPDSYDPRVAFVFQNVSGETFGEFGAFGGGAAGQEVDRHDFDLGTPPTALLLASSEDLSDGYRHVVEELQYSTPGLGGTEDPDVRADMTYFTNDHGGAVFSVGSMAWCGALAHNNYDNDVARISENVLRHFLSEATP